MDGWIEPCERGFHFCGRPGDVLDYYGGKGCRYAEVEALGEVIDGDGKSVTNKLRVVRELTGAELMDAMYKQEGLDPAGAPFPAEEAIRARENGTLGKLLPSGTDFPVRLANGERNVLAVGRDGRYTYLLTKYLMAEPAAMNGDVANEGGWPACGMREHVHRIYDMLPEEFREAILPMHIRQNAKKAVLPMPIRQVCRGKEAECTDKAFLLSASNVFGKDAWEPERDCGDTQVDIFREPANRLKRRPGASSASWWWLRSASSSDSFRRVSTDGSDYYYGAGSESGVVVGFCIEDRGPGRPCPDKKGKKTKTYTSSRESEGELAEHALACIGLVCLFVGFIIARFRYVSLVVALIILVRLSIRLRLSIPLRRKEAEGDEADSQSNGNRMEEDHGLAGYLGEIRYCKNRIGDEEVIGQLRKIEETPSWIAGKIESDPSAASRCRRLTEYYMPATLRLRKSCAEIEEHPRRGANASKIMEESREALGVLNTVLESTLDSMYEDAKMDAAAEVSVMKKMLAQDGFQSGSDFQPMKPQEGTVNQQSYGKDIPCSNQSETASR